MDRQKKTGGAVDSFRIRPAVAADAGAIGALKSRVWPRESVNSSRIQEALSHPGHAALAAWCEADPAGFVDGFLTRSAAGLPRWEVDLLAVAPEHQGRGLGTRLVTDGLQSGGETGARAARGLVRLDNLAGQRVFEHCGFSLCPRHLVLYVLGGLDGPCPDGPVEGHWVQVQTFDYSGLWLEERFTETALKMAAGACRARGLDQAGALTLASTPSSSAAPKRTRRPLNGCWNCWVVLRKPVSLSTTTLPILPWPPPLACPESISNPSAS